MVAAFTNTAHAAVASMTAGCRFPPPNAASRGYYLQRTRFESMAERKLRRRQLTEDGNVEISGRDLR
jgi:hypothetical protein